MSQTNGKYKILIVDDEPDIREVLRILLKSEGYSIIEAENGEQAVQTVSDDKEIDIAVMDIMMPGISGVEACEQIRKFSAIPVLFLTAKSQDQDKIKAYTLGGDDYLVKPFSQTELLMKIKSLLRRYKEYNAGQTNPAIESLSDKIAVNLKKHIATKDDEILNLTEKEFEILKFFLEHRGQVVETKDLYEGVWQEQYLPSASNTIMVHVLNLRKKIEEDANNPQIIKTVWGKGYRVD
ncbi:MAG TPA: response regulator transcription factor [Anaerovoracaceae bacterium]|nr:response regulator transcription factor [Anaerovoracaceae bacterium]